MVRIILCLISILICQSAFALSRVTATIDNNPVMINESVVLTITADDDVDADALDTSVLSTNFIVGNTSVSRQTSMVNFKTSRSTTWTTVLIPKKTGQIIIPAFTIEGKQSEPIALIVLKNNNAKGKKANRDLYISTEVSKHSVYVQEQFTLTVKLHFASELKRGSLTEPSMKDAVITQIGKDKETTEIENGKRYRVIERTYAIKPQQSGELTLTPPMFSGEVMPNSSRHSMFFSFADSKPVSVIADDINIRVQPMPEQYHGQWLPSELLSLDEEWQPASNQFTVGEPITRTIRLTALGLSEEQLPKIDMPLPSGLKVYPDQAQNHTTIKQGKVISQKVQNFAIVASKPGTYHLPEIKVPWWNTVINRMQTATIAAKTITVLPSKDSDNSITQAIQQPLVNNNETQCEPSQPVIKTEQPSQLQWLFLILWLMTLAAWIMTAFRRKKIKPQQKTSSINYDYLALIKACKQNDGAKVLTLLIPWANSLQKSKNICKTIDDVINTLNNEQLTQAIMHLQRSYFAKSPQPWQGDELLALIHEISKQDKKQKTSDDFSINP